MPFSYVVPIVEGHGEVSAVPALLRRIGSEIANVHVDVNSPIRVAAGTFLNRPVGFEKYVSLAANIAATYGGLVLILLDCEDNCPGKLGPEILEAALKVRSDVPILVVLAYREFETWFIYAAASLAGTSGLPADLQPDPRPEGFRGAKGWFACKMPNGYKETTHQVAFASQIDITLARSSHSFNRFVSKTLELLTGTPG